jgi:hypothetical protein
MREREMMARINGFIEGFDRRLVELVKKGMRNVVLPATLGVGLALGSGCGDDRTTPGTRQPSTQSDASQNAPMYAAPFVGDGGIPTPQPEYAAPFPSEDGGAVALYAAPYPDVDAGVPGPQPEYAAPFPEEDAGVAPMYAAPYPGDDAGVPGPQPEYAAPFPDGGPVALYAAPFPGADASSDGPTVQPMYAAPFPGGAGQG